MEPITLFDLLQSVMGPDAADSHAWKPLQEWVAPIARRVKIPPMANQDRADFVICAVSFLFERRCKNAATGRIGDPLGHIHGVLLNLFLTEPALRHDDAGQRVHATGLLRRSLYMYAHQEYLRICQYEKDFEEVSFPEFFEPSTAVNEADRVVCRDVLSACQAYTASQPPEIRTVFRLRHYPLLQELDPLDAAYAIARQAQLPEARRLLNTDEEAALVQMRNHLEVFVRDGNNFIPFEWISELLDETVNTLTVRMRRLKKRMTALFRDAHDGGDQNL